ncbi:MAG: DUF86 domain-containing protein [Chloroflexi bacterium]|nr:DUF86 domain-containing protein [Chloroflexota bacterium]
MRLYLIHITEKIADIREFTHAGRDEFMASKQIQAAVKYALQTLAESTQRLPDDLKASHPEIDWVAIAGLRNRLVHAYLGIDLEILWDIVANDLEPLHQAVEDMRSSH